MRTPSISLPTCTPQSDKLNSAFLKGKIVLSRKPGISNLLEKHTGHCSALNTENWFDTVISVHFSTWLAEHFSEW